MKKLAASATALALVAVPLAVVAGAPSAAPAPLAAHLEPILGHLLVPGDRVTVAYEVDTPGVVAPAGTLFVRTDVTGSFERVPLRLRRGASLRATLPPRLLRGHELRYYAVIRDPGSGRSVRVPAAGARAPDFAFVLRQPVTVRLGAHRFGHPSAPEAVVARIDAGGVGWQTQGVVFGPQTFVVARDRSVWLADGLDSRLLVFRPGHPGRVARTVPLPFYEADSDVAPGPGDTFYVLRGLWRPNPRVVLERVSPDGRVWQSELAGALSNREVDLSINTALRTGPDGRPYAVSGRPGSAGGERGWMPLASAAGAALPVAAQRRGDTWPYQPVSGGLRLLSSVYSVRVDTAPHEARFALVDRRGHVVRAWRVLSTTDINFGYATPELVRGDPVVVLDATAGAGRRFEWEYVVLRLGPHGTRARLSLRHAVFGDNLLADVRVGSDGSVYQLASSPATGVEIDRYSLGGGQ